MKSKKTLAATLVFGSVILAALAGSTVGTMAWYAYVTHTSLAYKGTSVRKSEQLQVGIVDEQQWFTPAKLTEYKLTREEIDGKSIVFAKVGSGFTSAPINYYLERAGHARTEMPPITSRYLDIDGELELYKALEANYPINTHAAEDETYVQVPFAFRVVDANNEFQVHEHVWVTGMEAKTLGEYKTHEAIRTYFENVNESTHFLVNPSSQESELTKRRDRVAGVLDLNGDGYYDYDLATMREIVYGDIVEGGTIQYSSTPYVAPEPNPVDDVNGVGDNTPSTFVAKHMNGVYTVDKTSLASLTRYSYYDTLSTVKPNDDGTGRFSDGKPVSYTNDNGIGYTNLTVYIEGWDHEVVNRIINTKFELGIQFEIDRV